MEVSWGWDWKPSTSIEISSDSLSWTVNGVTKYRLLLTKQIFKTPTKLLQSNILVSVHVILIFLICTPQIKLFTRRRKITVTIVTIFIFRLFLSTTPYYQLLKNNWDVSDQFRGFYRKIRNQISGILYLTLYWREKLKNEITAYATLFRLDFLDKFFEYTKVSSIRKHFRCNMSIRFCIFFYTYIYLNIYLYFVRYIIYQPLVSIQIGSGSQTLYELTRKWLTWTISTDFNWMLNWTVPMLIKDRRAFTTKNVTLFYRRQPNKMKWIFHRKVPQSQSFERAELFNKKCLNFHH